MRKKKQANLRPRDLRPRKLWATLATLDEPRPESLLNPAISAVVQAFYYYYYYYYYFALAFGFYLEIDMRIQRELKIFRAMLFLLNF